MSIVASALLVLGLLAGAPPTTDEASGAVTVTVLGGESAVPAAVTDQLQACATGGSGRLSGADRFATAAAVSQASFPDGADEVVVASGSGFADALAAGPAAAQRDAPLLLALPDRVPAATRDELARLDPQRVVLAGGQSALSREVEAVLGQVAPTERLAGDDRYATAAVLASESETQTAWVATGTGWPDALAAGPAAAAAQAPLLLTARDRLPAATRDHLARMAPERIVAVGGTAAISESVHQQLGEFAAEVTRVAGADRFATAAAVAEASVDDAAQVVMATGGEPADALSAVPLAARSGAPLLLAAGSSLPQATVDALERLDALRCRAVELAAGPAERVALGGGVTLAVTGPTGTVKVGTRSGRVLLPGAAELDLAYPTPDADAEPVTWSQTVDAGSDRLVVSQPWRGERAEADGGITLGWHADGGWDAYRREVEAASGLTVSAPVSLQLDASGRLTGEVDGGFVADVQTQGADVWPAVASLNADHIRAAVADPDRRSALAEEVSERARRAGADGVNVDLEGWTHETTDAVTDFVRQLTAAVHEWGGVTSLDLTPMTDTWATPPESEHAHWSTAPQRRALSAAVDYVVVMAYDQHNRFRPAGPVAAPGWVEEAVRYQLRFTEPDRLILGVPLYGRVWDPDALHRPEAVPIGRIAALARRGARRPDPDYGVDRVELPDGRFLWAEDHAGLAHRTGLVDELGLAGIAVWRLGFDDTAVWSELGD